MSKIDIDKLKASVESKHEPFDFHLYLVLSQGGSLTDCPYCEDKTFLDKLLKHYETTEEYELCLDLRKRLRAIA